MAVSSLQLPSYAPENASGNEGTLPGGVRFGFGENWSRFLRVLNEERISKPVNR